MVTSTETNDHARIVQAIADAEANTSGEIFCVLARRVSSYRDVSLFWSAMAALLLPLLLMPLVFDPSAVEWLNWGWQAAHISAREMTIGHSIAGYALLQAILFVLVYLLTLIPVVRRFLTPRAMRRERTRRVAVEQFLAHGIHITEARTGVLIFASLYDHQVEIVADDGIHDKVEGEVWADAAAALARGMKRGDVDGGFVDAIGLCGAVLAEHFPPPPNDVNEIENKLVVI